MRSGPRTEETEREANLWKLFQMLNGNDLVVVWKVGKESS